MKKLLISLLAFHFSLFTAYADEGMWTLYNLPSAVFEQMKQYGFQLSQDQLYKSDDAVKNAVVNFGGYCSGVVVRLHPQPFNGGARLPAEWFLCQVVCRGIA